jgi:hypothetical protein
MKRRISKRGEGKMKGFKKGEFKLGLDSFFRLESASSTALATILLFGITFSIFSVVYLGYVPEWKTDEEHSHMSKLWEDMIELKSKIDKTTIVMMSTPNSSVPKFTTTMILHTGNPKIPFISSTKSTGTLSLNTNLCKMVITPTNENATVINCGTIAYNSNNKDYTDQIFKYENGALILAQKEKAVMRLYPSIRVSEVSSGNYTFFINTVEILGMANTLSSNSDGSIRLKGGSFETLYDSDTSENEGAFLLTVYTDHPDAWEEYFNETMAGAGLVTDEDYALDRIGSNYLTFIFPEKGSTNSLKRLYVGKTAINAELGIG